MVRNYFRRIILGILIFALLGFFGLIIYKNSTMPKVPEKFQEIEFKTDKDEVFIGIISDTQTTAAVTTLPKEIDEIFKNVDLIIHAGDVENFEILKNLEKISNIQTSTPIFAVKGNMDFGETKKLPAGILLKIYNWRIGVVHSAFSFWIGSHFNLVQEIVAEKLAKRENFDILIFGHTHQAYLKEINSEGKKILLINPGSPMMPFLGPPSVALLKINKKDFTTEIIKLQ